MPLTTDQLLQAFQATGVRRPTRRKLERWAELGAIPRPVRKGKGRGKGWQFLWPDSAFPAALFIADALGWQQGRRFDNGVLWAWLRGAPIELGVVRRYLVASFRRQHARLEANLAKRKRDDAEDTLDLVDRLAGAVGHRHPALRGTKAPRKVRGLALREALAQVVGDRWSNTAGETATNYQHAWEAILAPLGLPWNTSISEATRQQKVFSYPNLQRMVSVSGATDGELLAARDAFAEPLYRVGKIEAILQSRRRVRNANKVYAATTRTLYNVLFQMDPAWVTTLFLYNVLQRR